MSELERLKEQLRVAEAVRPKTSRARLAR